MKKAILRMLMVAFAIAIVDVRLANATAQPMSTRQIATEVSKATVSIRCALPGGVTASGSGFITDSSGTIVTNYHVVEGAERIEVRTAAGDTYEVTAIRAVDRRHDIAVIQIPGFKLPTVTLGDSDNLGPGEPVVVIGNALGILDNSVTTGVVSGIREVDGSKLIQMSAAVSPGNSGGPVVNGQGEVVAITVSKNTKGENLNFSIPINFVRGYLAQPAQQGLTLLRRTDEMSLFAGSPKAFPKRWLSLTTNIDRSITVSDDVMLVEPDRSEQDKQTNHRNWFEFRRIGDKWTGTAKEDGTCTFRSWPEWKQKNCQMDYPAEISLMTSSRIEGSAFGPAPDDIFDCQKCTFGKPLVKKPFTWIPAAE